MELINYLRQITYLFESQFNFFLSNLIYIGLNDSKSS